MRKLSVRCAEPRQIRRLSQNVLRELRLELWADHVWPIFSSLIVNQSCHAFDGGKPRDPVGAGIFASLTRDTSGSRLPANTFLKSCVVGSSGSAGTSTSSYGIGGTVVSASVSALNVGPRGFIPSPGHGGGNCVDAAPWSLPPNTLPLQRDRSHLQDPVVHQSCLAHPRKGWRHYSPGLWIVFNNTLPGF